MVRALKKRDITHKSLLIIFINRFIKNGSKFLIYKNFLSVLIVLKSKLKKSFNLILSEIMNLISPLIQLIPKFASGVIYLIPDFPKYKKSFTLGLNFLIKAIKNRKENSLNYRILYEFRDILNNKGLALKYKQEFYKLAITNRHLLFKFSKLK